MHNYVPINRNERKTMLASVGLDIDKLYDHIPDELKFNHKKLAYLPEEPMSEWEIKQFFADAAALNRTVDAYDSYLGAGMYDHYVPSVVSNLTQRQEFLTAYTPYQQEIAQGTLQAGYEFQTYLTRITGMDVANSSMYDGATAAAEAALMAFRDKRKADKIWLSGGLHPQYIATIKTYLEAQGMSVEVGELNADGTSCDSYPEETGYAAFMVQSPNFYGVVENLSLLTEKAHAQKALSIAVCDPHSLAILETPGHAACDIACGEAQGLGGGLNYGGPSLGYLCCTEKLVRKMPGRIVGATTDAHGKTAYVLTLQAREQHIRRERATSNICTSQQLLATSATIYMALMGSEGLREVALQCADKARYLHDQLIATGLFTDLYRAPFYGEFALKAKDGLNLDELNRKLLDEKIIGGPVLDDQVWLLAVTETKQKEQMDHFVQTVQTLAGKEA